MKLSDILCITVQQDRDVRGQPTSRWSVLLVGSESQEAPVEGVHKSRALEIATAIRKHADWAEFLVEGDTSDRSLRTTAKDVVEAWKRFVQERHDHGIHVDTSNAGDALMDAVERLARHVS